MTGVGVGATVTLTAAPDADPIGLAAAAVGRLLHQARQDPAEVTLLVLGCVDPADWPGAADTPLLDGEFAADVVRRVVLANGLRSATPFGVFLDAERVQHLAAETAAAIMAAEHLPGAIAVAVYRADTHWVAEATAIT